MAIHRRVFLDRKMRSPFKADFTSTAGEDVMFCQRAKKAGYKVMVDFDIWCEHRVEVHANGIANAYMEVLNRGAAENEGGKVLHLRELLQQDVDEGI